MSAAAALCGPAEAADRMVGQCADRENLCAADPATGVVTPITADGATAHYSFPYVSTDGTILAFLKNGVPFRGGPDPASATLVFDPEQYVRSMAVSPDGQGVSVRTSGLTFGTFVSRLYVLAPDHAPWFEESSSYVHDTGWLGREALNASPTSDDTVCVYRPGASCARPVATVPGAQALFGPEGSPDATRLVVSVGTGDPLTYRLVLVDAATAAPIRDLAPGPSDNSPSWSPDGSTVSFTRGADTWTVPADGSAPPRMIVAGLTSASWGRDPTPPAPPPAAPPPVAPPPGGTPAPGSTPAGTASLQSRSVRASRTGRIRLPVRCDGQAGCLAQRWKLTLRGRAATKVVLIPALRPKQTRIVTATLFGSARRALRRAPGKRLRLRLARPGRAAVTLTVRR